ncbi:hypothetical protein H0R92_11810 [Treponema sp. OMZ 840]|uniref:hypothetical protein n=1 Tax=Treponema sp. OMZ 840 TaxID=244313 RepID=UPI003D8AF9D2
MKKLLSVCVIVILSIGLLCAQAQNPGFSNTVHAAFGQPVQKNSQVRFFGFTDYFTGNISVGKLVFAGDITWQLVPSSGGIQTEFLDRNVNVVIKPIKALDIGLGTNLNWTVGPGPSSGPQWTAYNRLYYGGINLANSPNKISGDKDYPQKGFKVINYYAQQAFAVRYKYENIFEAGFSLPVLRPGKNFNAGVGIRGNIKDKFSIGFAYNGPFNAGENYLYLGVSTTAVKGFTIGAYWNMLTDTSTTVKDGGHTVGALLDFEVKGFRIKPEGAITFWTDTDWGPAGYLGVDAYMSFTKEILGGINASWGIGSDLIKNDPNNLIKAGARLDINPYIVWNINKTNVFSAGVHLSPIWWRNGYSSFAWEIPIAWKLKF